MPVNNKVMLIGNLGDHPKSHIAKAGHEFVTFSLATNRYKKNADGTKNTQTAWHDCVVYGPRAQVIKNYAKKGSGLVIEGELGYSNYEKNGVHVKKAVINVYDFQFIGGDRGQTQEAKPSESVQSVQTEATTTNPQQSTNTQTPTQSQTQPIQPAQAVQQALQNAQNAVAQHSSTSKAPPQTNAPLGIDPEFANALGDSDFVNDALVDNLNIPF